MFGRPNNTAATHIFLGYQIQSSIFGLPIPIVYGQQRMAGNVIWSGNWQATPYSGSGGKGNKGGKAGKSGAGGQIYTYSSAIIIGLCAGPIRGIGHVWVNKVRLSVSAVNEEQIIPYGGVPLVPDNAGIAPPVDQGVTNITTGQPMVLFNPSAQVLPFLGKGQYQYNNGIYTFTQDDGGSTVLINSTNQTFIIPPFNGIGLPGNVTFTAASLTSNLINDNGVSQSTTFNAIATDYGNPSGSTSLVGSQQVNFVRVDSNPQKGQYTYDPVVGYVFNPVDAGQIVTISYTWNDPNYLTDGNPIQVLNLALFTGLEGQDSWEYLQTNFPSQALGYSGLAYLASTRIDLGYSGALSNYGFEVLGLFPFGGGIVDAAIPSVIPHFLSDPFVGAGFPAGAIGDLSELRNYTIASNIFISCVVDQQRSASDWLSDWLTIANCEAVWSNGVLKFRSYGDKTIIGNGVTFTPVTSPVYDLDDDDFVGDPETALLSVTRPTIRDAYNSVTVEWTNRGNNYSAEPVEERDDWSISLYGLRPAPTQQLHSITTSGVAQMIANTKLQRSVYIRNQYKFKLSAVKYQLLEPMDMVTLSEPEMGLDRTPVRIKSITENDNLELELECEEFPWGTATPTLFPKQTIGPFGPVYYQNPGNTLPILFYEPDPPAVIAGGVINTLYIALAGAQNWGGCHVYVSTDGGSSYTHVGKQTGASTAGYLTAVLPPVTSPDDTSVLALDMSVSQGDLTSYTKTQEDNLVSLCVVDQELISYRTATLTGNKQFELTHLQRAAYESPLSQHNTGAPFGFFDDAMFVWNFDQSNVNTTVYFKFLSFNKAGLMPQNLDNVPAYPYFIHGERPPYPWSTHDPSTANAPNNIYRSPNFGLKQKLLSDVNGNITPQFIIDGFGICDSFSQQTVAPQIASVTVSQVGGSIAGNQVIVIGVWAQGIDGLFTRMSLMSVEIPEGTDTNLVQFSVLFANPSDQGWIAITPDTNEGWFGPGSVATPTSSTGSIQPQLQALANQELAITHAAGLNVDQWLFFWSKITGATLSGSQAESLILALGETDETRGDIIGITNFLNALPTVVGLQTYEFDSIGELDTPVPDQQFDHYVLQARTGYVLGVTGQPITAISGGALTFAADNSPDGSMWVGRTATCYGLKDPTKPIPIIDVAIAGATKNTLTIDAAAAALLHVGDRVLVRLRATAATAGRIEDSGLSFWVNTQPPNGPTVQGMTPSAYKGKQILITRGTGFGQIANVVDNDDIGFNVSPVFKIVPDTTSEFVVINSSIDFQTITGPLTYTALEGSATLAQTTALQAALTAAGNQYLINNPGTTGLNLDQWLNLYQQITGVTITPDQALAIFNLAGVPTEEPDRSDTLVPVTTLTNALPGIGTPVELTLNIDNSYRHFFVQVLTSNNEGVTSLVPFSPYRLIFSPGFAGPNNFGTPQDTFYIGFLPGGLPGPIPAPGATVGSTLSVESVPGILFGWDAIAEINIGAAATVFDVRRTRTVNGVNVTVSIFDDPSQYITIPGGSLLLASGTVFSKTNSDIQYGDRLQLRVVSVDGTNPAQRATVNLFWKNMPPTGGVVAQ